MCVCLCVCTHVYINTQADQKIGKIMEVYTTHDYKGLYDVDLENIYTRQILEVFLQTQ